MKKHLTDAAIQRFRGPKRGSKKFSTPLIPVSPFALARAVPKVSSCFIAAKASSLAPLSDAGLGSL